MMEERTGFTKRKERRAGVSYGRSSAATTQSRTTVFGCGVQPKAPDSGLFRRSERIGACKFRAFVLQ